MLQSTRDQFRVFTDKSPGQLLPSCRHGPMSEAILFQPRYFMLMSCNQFLSRYIQALSPGTTEASSTATQSTCCLRTATPRSLEHFWGEGTQLPSASDYLYIFQPPFEHSSLGIGWSMIKIQAGYLTLPSQALDTASRGRGKQSNCIKVCMQHNLFQYHFLNLHDL